MTSPGIGAEAGASLNALMDMYQGFFLAPHVVSQAVKGAIFTSALLEEVGMTTEPHYAEPRTDLIQSVSFQTCRTNDSILQSNTNAFSGKCSIYA